MKMSRTQILQLDGEPMELSKNDNFVIDKR